MKLPMVIVKEPSGSFSAGFLDLPGCLTSGHDLEDLMDGVQDAVETWMHGKDASAFPARASTLTEAMEHEYAQDGAIVFVEVDTGFMNKKTVKANLTVPERHLTRIDKFVEKHPKFNRSSLMTHATLEFIERTDA